MDIYPSMKLDRSLQLIILEYFKDSYPDIESVVPLQALNDNEDFTPNMHYLIEHGLIKKIGMSGAWGEGITPDIIQAKITAKGLDFLEDDGGVGAILKTITVKFDPDDFRKLIELIALKLDKSKIPSDKKESLMSLLKDAPAHALKSLYTKLINTGVDKVTDLYGLVQTTLSGSPPPA